ncbi:NUDIX hydrolase [Xenorhabdus sp. Flor]|uniref:NUDIX hydrolase n=1 Tax=Xenorhabdus cabanillasii TaxID=351673 RepID=UPI0019BDFE54|nr:NUDIX hydrolase [Xenorhabdus sp. Flor]MBD2816064.1 NUDIX hydrolase [Xenorhabdus sp. Flor]
MDINLKNKNYHFNIRTCCFLWNKNKEDILVQRKISQYEEDWALPGGKVKVGETSLQALARELDEEFSIEVVEAQLIGISEQFKILKYPLHQIIFLYNCLSHKGKPILVDKTLEYKWLNIKDFKSVHPIWASELDNYENIKYINGFPIKT